MQNKELQNEYNRNMFKYNISKDKIKGIGSWSESDIVFFLQSGIKPNGDFAGQEMSKIIENGTSYLIKEDLEKISAYLLSNKNK